ncbi:hypothetical protein [Nostoc sp. CCY 9925]
MTEKNPLKTIKQIISHKRFLASHSPNLKRFDVVTNLNLPPILSSLFV